MSEYCQSWDKSVEEYIDECKTAFKSDPENSVYSFSIEEERLNIRKLLQDAQSGSTFKAILSSMLLKTVIFMYECYLICWLLYVYPDIFNFYSIHLLSR